MTCFHILLSRCKTWEDVVCRQMDQWTTTGIPEIDPPFQMHTRLWLGLPNARAENSVQVFCVGGSALTSWVITAASLGSVWAKCWNRKLELGIKPWHSHLPKDTVVSDDTCQVVIPKELSPGNWTTSMQSFVCLFVFTLLMTASWVLLKVFFKISRQKGITRSPIRIGRWLPGEAP